MKKYVIVDSVSSMKKDNGEKGQHRSYVTIGFKTPINVIQKDELTGEIFACKVEPKKTAINLYEKSYLNDQMQFGYDFQEGERALGDIVTRKVTPYSIPVLDSKESETEASRTVNTYTTVVLGDTESEGWDAIVRNTFRSRGHELNDTATPINFSLASSESIEEEKAQIANTEKAIK